MTGHMLFGKYQKVTNNWIPTKEGPLSDPFNSHIRLIFSLSDGPGRSGKHLALSDMRKFAKVTLVKTSELEECLHLEHLGPEPLDPKFTITNFKLRINTKPMGKIKQVLMDQRVIAGIGNIYSDEILWRAGVHPLSLVSKIPEKNMKEMFKAMKETLRKGIKLGGDSMSDYRNIEGKKGEFQEYHRAYQHTGEPCTKRNCKGHIERTVVGGRSAHFCPVHQKLYK